MRAGTHLQYTGHITGICTLTSVHVARVICVNVITIVVTAIDIKTIVSVTGVNTVNGITTIASVYAVLTVERDWKMIASPTVIVLCVNTYVVT